jgi:phage terminase large subunit-like protein
MPLPDSWTNLPLPNLLALQARLNWIRAARPQQLTPAGDWRIWLILAGRGWGKTRTGAEDLAYHALWQPGARLAVVAPTYADARDTCVEGESGLLRVMPRECLQAWNRSFGVLRLTNGSTVKLFSAEQPERLRGPQHHRVWCDELGAWERPETFDQILFGLRLGARPRLVITTTPRPTPLLRGLLARQNDVYVTQGHTRENSPNLAPEFVQALEERYGGTRLARQELAAEMLSEAEGALWTDATLDCVVTTVPALRRVVVAVDPALQEKGTSDETGIIAAGVGEDGLFYVLADGSGQMPSDVWAARAAQLAQIWQAEKIRVEVNAGGALLSRIVQHYAPNCPCEPVHAVHGKWDRAVPVAALYEQKRVRHCGALPALVEQMRRFTPEAIARRSPDRVDALVWALSALMQEKLGSVPKIRSLV